MQIIYGNFTIDNENTVGDIHTCIGIVVEDKKILGFIGENGSQFDLRGEEAGVLTYKNKDENDFEKEVLANWSNI